MSPPLPSARALPEAARPPPHLQRGDTWEPLCTGASSSFSSFSKTSALETHATRRLACGASVRYWSQPRAPSSDDASSQCPEDCTIQKGQLGEGTGGWGSAGEWHRLRPRHVGNGRLVGSAHVPRAPSPAPCDRRVAGGAGQGGSSGRAFIRGHEWFALDGGNHRKIVKQLSSN